MKKQIDKSQFYQGCIFLAVGIAILLVMLIEGRIRTNDLVVSVCTSLVGICQMVVAFYKNDEDELPDERDILINYKARKLTSQLMNLLATISVVILAILYKWSAFNHGILLTAIIVLLLVYIGQAFLYIVVQSYVSKRN